MSTTPVITALKNRDRRFEPLGLRTQFWETAGEVGQGIDPSGELQWKVREEAIHLGKEELRRRPRETE